jgi:hypothetical protein
MPEDRSWMFYRPTSTSGPPPPDDGTRLLIAMVKELPNNDRARLRYWMLHRCDREGHLASGAEPAEVILCGIAALFAFGVRELPGESRAYLRRWLLSWYADNGWLREPSFVTRRRATG